MARAKMSRHELKAQDEITTKLHNILETAYARRKEVLSVVVAVVILILGFLGWNLYSARQNSAAQMQLSAAVAVFNDTSITSDEERYQRTITEAQKTVDEYGSSQSGLLARYYIGLSQAGLGDTAAATATLQEVIDNGDESVRGVAQFALAGVHKRQGDTQQAIDVLKDLEQSGAYTASAVAYELGAVHETSSQPELARDYYVKVIMEHSDSPFRPDAETGLRRMGFPVPTPVSAVTP